MTKAQLTWDNFLATVFVRGRKGVHRIDENPRIEVYADGIGNRIGLLLEVPADAILPASLTRLKVMTCRVLSDGKRSLLDIAPLNPALNRQFYHFAIAVAERFNAIDNDAIAALGAELACFSELLGTGSTLSHERQLGLLGELLFLRCLLAHKGPDALDAWLGPLGEPHDFRLAAVEFEVKATVRPYRVHTIHGPDQLTAVVGSSLFLVSVLLGPPGAAEGLSIQTAAEDIANRFANAPGKVQQFRQLVESYGCPYDDVNKYSGRYVMRRPIALIPVNHSFPIISRSHLQALLSHNSPRLEDFQYDINLDGLGWEEGTPEFEATVRTIG